jgi:acetyltransferase
MADARALIDRLKTAPILKGVRGQRPGDTEALAALLVRVGGLAASEAHIDQLDLNPLFVYPEGEGVVAVDALAVASGVVHGHGGH